MSPRTYFIRHTQNLPNFFKATVLLALLLFILHPAVIFGQSPPPNIQNTGKASDVNLRSNLKVNPSTHAVEFEITLANYPGRGGLGVPVKLSYSSKVWRVAYQSYTPSSNGETLEGFTSVNAWFNGGWTSSVGVPVILHDDDASRYSQFGQPLPETTDCNTTPCYRIDRMFIRMPNDAVHELRSSDEPYSVGNGFSLPFPTPDDLYAVDGSGLRYQRSTQTLFFPDGSRFIFSTTTPRLIDKNGNTLTYTGASPFNLQNNIEVGVTDTLTRSIPAFRKTFANNTDVVYSLPGLNNVPINYTFKWKRLGAPGVLTTPQSLHYIAEFGCPPAAGQEPPASGVPHLFFSDFSNRTFICNGIELFDPVVLHQILLPTGQSYTFTYNVYGEIEKVVLPSGGYERYEYESLTPLSVTAPLYSQANRGVKKRHVSKTGNLADEITWNYAFTGTFPYGSGNPGTYILTTTAPDQSLTDRYLHTDSLLGSFGFNIDQGKSGMVYDERQYSAPDGSGVRQLLQRKLTEWVTTGSNASNQNAQSARRNARVAKEVAILLATGTGSALTQTTVHNYDLTFQFSIGAMETSVAQYDWVVVSQSTAQSSPISSFTTPSQPLRRSETTNLLLDTNIAQATRDAYRARHLVALPSSTRIKNGPGTIVAQTSMQYDQYSLTTVGSVSGWIDPQNTHRGNLTISGRWLNTTGNYVQTHNTFDQFGNVRTATDANGNQSQVGYSSNHAYATTTTTAIPDPSGQHGSTVAFTSTTNYDITSGLMLSTTDPNGHTTSMDYSDPLNRLTQITQPDGAHTTYIYSDAPGDLYVRVLTDLDSSRVMETRTYFDGIGRVVRNFLYDGTPSTPWTVTDTYYDTTGRISKASNPYRVSSPSGIVPSTCSVCTTTAYDALGRVTSVITSDSAQTSASYGGNTTGILGPTVLTTDPAGKARKNVMDALGRLVAVYENPGGLNYETTYTYDVLGNRTGVTQGTQPPRSFVYDSLSRLVSAMNPESGTINYQYDNNGNITQKTDARGIISAYTYDALNRNKTVNYSDTSISPDVSRIYDGASNGKGRLWRNYAGGTETTGSNVEKTLIHSYDALGRPLILKQSFKVNGVWFLSDYQVTRTYNLAGAVATQTYPSGKFVIYNYDAAGRLADKDGQNLAFTGNLGDGALRTYSRGISYAPSGQLKQEQFGTNAPVYHKLHYNERQQLCDVRASNVNDEWGGELGALVNYYHTPVSHCASGANNNGNIVMSQTIINSVYFEDRYTYDALNRLTAVSEYLNGSTLAGSQQYDYDRWGNRNIIPGSLPLGFNTAFEKQDATNRLYAPGDLALPDTSRRIRYDAAGNQIKNTFTGYGLANFDAENHLTSIQDNLGGWSNYTYNADGQRTRRKISNQETWQIYGIDGELVAEYPANGVTNQPLKEYGYRNGQLLVVAPTETVWSDDAVPAGAAIAGDGESWNWVSSNPAPFSGSVGHQSNIVAGLHQHYFYGATATLSVNAGDKLFAYVYLDPSNMPSQIMLQFAEGGSWEHRAYWGANNLPWGVDGTNSRRYMGPLPAAGSWVRLEVPASLVGVEGQTLHGMAFSMWGGRATWDRVGKITAAFDTVWSDDGVPAGAAIAGDGESWNWTSSSPSPFSGSSAHQSNIVAGLHQHYFYGATATLSVSAGDKLVAYVYLDPSNMPSEIMLQWNDGSWEHRAYWGANNLPWGVDGTNSRRYMGPLPAAGSWQRLEVPASLVGLEGQTLHGMAFSMWGGRATWDRAGKTSSGGAGSSLQWMVSDHLGTPRMVIDQTGTLANVKRHDYLPFGEELFAGRSGLGYGQADGIRQQFTAKERDIETALDYFGARYYSSTQGRFTSFDPEGAGARESDPQSWNGYAYAGGNPVLFSDPDGREYRVCDPSGKTCTTVSDQEFHDERKALQATGNVYTGNGNFYERGQIRNAEGAVVAEYVQFSIDDLQHRQLAAIAAAVDPIPMATLQFFGLSAVIGTTGGVAYYVLGPTAAITTLKYGGERIVPPLVRRVLDEIKNRNGSPPPGHKGGKPFKNDGRDGGEVLPRTDSSGKPITYREYDVNPYQSGVNRGTERIVVGSDKRAYYTNDHYKTFTRIE